MTNASTIRHVKKIDEPSSNRTQNIDRSINQFSSYQNYGKEDTDREMSIVNGQQSQEQVTRFPRQEDKRVTASCRSTDFREMSTNLKRIDDTLNGMMKDRRSCRENDCSYENIADLQEFIRGRSTEDKRIDQPVVDMYSVFFGRRNSFNGESYDQDSSDGPMKFKHSATRNRPYSKNPTDWSPRSSMKNLSNNTNYTRKQQNVDRTFLDSKNGEMNVPENGERSILDDWSSGNNDGMISNVSNTVNDVTRTSIPSIVVNDHCENSVSMICGQSAFQSPLGCSDASSSSVFSPSTRTWVDSPLSYHVVASGPNSRCSSRAQSPGSGMQLESQLMPYNVIGSPLGSPQMPPMYVVTQGQSSPSSSSQSYSDTPSPLNYQTPLNHRTEDQLHDELACVSIWETFGVEGQGNTMSNETVTSFDNDLQLVDEVLKDLGNKSEGNEAAQVVPNSSHSYTSNYEDRPASVQNIEDDLQRISSVTSGLYSGISSKQDIQTRVFPSNSSTSYTDDAGARVPTYSSSPNSNLNYTYVCNTQNGTTSNDYESNRNQVLNFYDYNNVPNIGPTICYDDSEELQCSTEFAQCRQETSIFTDNKNSTHETNFPLFPESFPSSSIVSPTSTDGSPRVESNKLHIPEVVFSFRPNQPVSRSTERNIVPWPSLNLPSIGASERLKEGLNPKDVEKAMISLLKKPVEELAMGDEDGDTELMRLVGNPEELARKKAYLVPLVERLSNMRGALSMTNHRGEDALYLAAINCPEMPYVAGYLAATMLEKGIDISQKLYHIRGDSLIHSVASRGDSHGEVLAELLALKTTQGNAVFDLSKRNYDGRTALHVAVESHDPTGRGPKAVATVRLLLDNGADPNIKGTKCGDTALHMAAALSCDSALVKVLLSKAGSSTVNATDYNYNTPLHMAAAASNTVPLDRQKDVCWLLIQAGAQSNLQNRQGKTPLALVSAERKDLIRRIFYRKF